ncbi:MAG: class IV adenylate cyclase [Thermodesulfobacteriota bacterium]
MLEAEVKLALTPADAAALRARLAALGARALGSRAQVDTYFAHPTRDFASTDEALRLRGEDAALRITYKGPKLDPPRKTREEIEFALATDHPTAARLLQRLGFRVAAEVRKRREEWDVGETPRVSVTIDQVERLGTFCEIEVAAESVGEGRLRLREAQERLGLGHLAPIPESYLELLARSAAG